MTDVHQVVSTFERRDAVGHEVAAIRDRLRALGYGSDVYTVVRRPQDDESLPLERLPDGPGPAAVLYHYAIASAATRRMAELTTPVYVVHHNVTPARFFWGVDHAHYEACRQAATESLALEGRTRLVIAHSEFTRRELLTAGYRDVVVAPLLVPPGGDLEPPSASLLSRLTRATRPIVLTVGRVAPNKRIEDCVRALHAYRASVDPRAQLWIVGDDRRVPAYRSALERLCLDLWEEGAVQWTGPLADADLAHVYRAADVYVSMSEHEGFGGPLVEAMRAGLPVVAFDAGAVGETLGGAGVLLRTKRPTVVCEALHAVLRDGPLRHECIRRGLMRAEQLHDTRAFETLLGHLRDAGLPAP